MSPKRVVVPGRPGLTYSTAVAAEGEIVFVSGLNAVDDEGVLQSPGDVVGQTRAIYRKLASVLAAAGGSLADVVRTTDYVLSRDNYRATAEVRRELLGPDFPAATGVVVKELLGRGVLIEIDAVAVLGPREISEAERGQLADVYRTLERRRRRPRRSVSPREIDGIFAEALKAAKKKRAK